MPLVSSLAPATWQALCPYADSWRSTSGPRRSQLAAWRLGCPVGGTTLLALLQKPGQWAGWGRAPRPPGPQQVSVCTQETGEGGLVQLQIKSPP